MRVMAKQRGAAASISGSMALILIFRWSAPLIDVLGNDGLPAPVIDVDMLHHLFPAPAHPGQRFHLPLRRAQQLRGEVSECLRGGHPFCRSKLAQCTDCRVVGAIHLHQQQEVISTVLVDNEICDQTCEFGAPAEIHKGLSLIEVGGWIGSDK